MLVKQPLSDQRIIDCLNTDDEKFIRPNGEKLFGHSMHISKLNRSAMKLH